MDIQIFLTTVGAVYGDGIGSADPVPETVARSLDNTGTETGQHLQIADDNQLQLGAGGWTITGFFRPTFISGGFTVREILSKGSFDLATTASYRMYVTDLTDAIAVSVSDGSTIFTAQTGVSSIANNTWYFFEAVYNATTNVLSLALDRGVPVTTSSVTDPQSIEADFRIGSGSSTGFTPFKGQISQIGMWDRILSSGELDDLYNSGLGQLWANLDGATQSGILAYWELDELSTGVAQVDRLDSSSNNNDLTDNDHLASSSEVPV